MCDRFKKNWMGVGRRGELYASFLGDFWRKNINFVKPLSESPP